MVYLFEDDAKICNAVTEALGRFGIVTESYSKASEFFQAIEENLPQLVVFGAIPSEGDSLSLLRRLRDMRVAGNLPVIVLTGLAEEADRVALLDAGADDCMSKPIGIREFTARVRALLRRAYPGTEVSEFRVGPLYVQAGSRLVTVNDEPVTLTKKEFDILLYLLRSGGTVVSRERLLTEVWGYSDGESRTVDVHIRTLRSKLGAAGQCVETIRGVGYCIRT